jgi:hypothetical protein
MVDSPTSRNRLRKQEVGTNNNTWGTKLNEVLDCVDQVVDGVETVSLGGSASYTLTTSDYTTTDQAKQRVLLFTNAHASSSEAIVPSVEHQYTIKNSGAGAAVEVKTSAGTGVDVPNNRQCDVFCDGSNVYAGSANWISNYASTLTNDGDIVVKITMQSAIATAIAAASISNTGQVLVSLLDTTSGYLGAKLAAGSDITLTDSGAGNATLTIAAVPYWTAPRNLAFADSPITALDRDVLLIDTSGGAITVNLPSSGRVIIADTSGNASSNNITVTPAGADTVTFGTIDTDYFASEYRRRGTNWVLGI